VKFPPQQQFTCFLNISKASTRAAIIAGLNLVVIPQLDSGTSNISYGQLTLSLIIVAIAFIVIQTFISTCIPHLNH
jgi:hypothetical protein